MPSFRTRGPISWSMRCSSRGHAQNLAGKVSVQSPNLGDDGVCRRVLGEDASVRQYEAMAKVLLAELRSRLDQALAPETFLFAGFLQLNPIAQFPWDPGTERPHHLKPLSAQPAKPLCTILEGRFHRGSIWLVISEVMHMISSIVEPASGSRERWSQDSVATAGAQEPEETSVDQADHTRTSAKPAS